MKRVRCKWDRPGRGDGSAQRGRSVIYDCLVSSYFSLPFILSAILSAAYVGEVQLQRGHCSDVSPSIFGSESKVVAAGLCKAQEPKQMLRQRTEINVAEEKVMALFCICKRSVLTSHRRHTNVILLTFGVGCDKLHEIMRLLLNANHMTSIICSCGRVCNGIVGLRATEVAQ